ncbi:MAG: hypothetical protein HY064_07555 [Bacteroidetes bacterium]|nr:hypothetical protein [Bacteroidota bacterium]
MATTLAYTIGEESNERKAKIFAWIISASFAITLLLILIFLKIITPIPAIPPDPEVIAVEVGFDDGSGGTASVQGGGSQGNTGHAGTTDGGSASTATNPISSGSVTDPNSNNISSNPNVHSSLTQQQLNQLLANFNKNKGKATINIGGQGNGDPYTGGMGNGSGDGPGPNNGGDPGHGGNGGNNGTSYRHIQSKPEIVNPTQEEGIVVVLVHVDRDGKVTRAEIGNGGTTSNNTLRATATQSAYKIVFNADSSAPVDELLSIDIKFTLR